MIDKKRVDKAIEQLREARIKAEEEVDMFFMQNNQVDKWLKVFELFDSIRELINEIEILINEREEKKKSKEDTINNS